MLAHVLTDDQVRRVHAASIRILEEIGIQLPHEELLSRFADSGATVDRAAQTVKIPPDLVQRCVDQAGKQFTIHGRDPSRQAAFGLGSRNFNSIAGEASWIDEIGGARRYGTLADVQVACRIGEALENINIVGAMTDPHDVATPLRCIAVMDQMLRATTKPITFWFHDRASARYLSEMMVAVRGDERRARAQPLCYPLLEPISPLRFPFDGVDLLFETARLDLPVEIGPMAQMGVSAPCTLAATMAHENAEILAGICVTQLVQPGMRVCYGGIPHAFDMATTQLIFSGPEQAIFGVAMTQLGKHYGLPVYINVGLTDSKRVDAQAGLETGLTLMLGAAAGADVFGHMGICGVDQASSLDMLVFQDEVIGFVQSVMRELDFSDDAFAFEESAAAGPGGSFIQREHTALHFREALWFPKLLDRDFYQSWFDGGGLSAEERCRRRRDALLAADPPEPISDDLARALDDIVAAARRDLVPGQTG